MTDERLAALYRTYGPAIYERCRSLLKNGAEAEDATQEAFMNAQRYLAKAPAGPNAYAWLFRIATNVCLNQLRDSKAHAAKERELGVETTDDPDIQQVLADRLLAQSLILRLDEKLRLPAWLYYVDGLSQEEVGEVLSISRQTVIARLEAFREKGRKLLGLTP